MRLMHIVDVAKISSSRAWQAIPCWSTKKKLDSTVLTINPKLVSFHPCPGPISVVMCHCLRLGFPLSPIAIAVAFSQAMRSSDSNPKKSLKNHYPKILTLNRSVVSFSRSTPLSLASVIFVEMLSSPSRD